MNSTEVIKIFKCLADKSRLQIVKALMKKDMYVERLAERLDLSPATISFHLKKLEDAKIVTFYREQYYVMYSLNKDMLKMTLLALIEEGIEDDEQQEIREAEYRQKVIAAFFEYGRLKNIPAQRKKEHIILEKIAENFEKGRIYSEQEVNEIIGGFHDDYCTLRRDMIAEGIMRRDENGYWKLQ